MLFKVHHAVENNKCISTIRLKQTEELQSCKYPQKAHTPLGNYTHPLKTHNYPLKNMKKLHQKSHF